MTPAGEMRQALEAYVDAVNRHDVDAMLALRHPESYLEPMGVGEAIRGLDDLRGFYERFFSAMPDYRLEIDASAFGEDVGVVWGRFSGTMGETAVELPVAFVCTFRDGRFCGDHMYFNAGALPLTAR